MFGSNQGNVYFMGLNWGNDNEGVREFDSIFGLTYPSVSGSQGGGNLVYTDYNILSYPTVIVITPDHQIVEQYIWLPDEANITQAIVNAGGLIVGMNEPYKSENSIQVFPQPAHDFVNVSLEVKSGISITFNLYQLTGKLIYSQNFQAHSDGIEQVRIPLTGLVDGMYLLKIGDVAGPITTRKVTVVN